MLFTGVPIAHSRTMGFYVYGVRDTGSGRAGAAARLEGLRGFVQRLIAEDAPVLDTIASGRSAGGLRPASRPLLQVRARVSAGPAPGRLSAACRGTSSAAEVDAFRTRLCEVAQHRFAVEGRDGVGMRQARGGPRVQPHDALPVLPQQGRDPRRGAHRRLRRFAAPSNGRARAGGDLARAGRAVGEAYSASR